jgi:hypothetical protein
MVRTLFFILLILFSFAAPSIMKRFTYGFKIAKMELVFPSSSEWDVPFQPQWLEILNQPYSFLGKGAQSYVFESQDGQYVIKLFRYDHPFSDEKVKTLFNACKIAQDILKEETGLLYVHLNQTQLGLPVLQCRGPLGGQVKFPLDKYRFALQKKAAGFRETFERIKNDPIEMQKRIDQFLQLLYSRVEKGIRNTDPNLHRNFGFLEDRAIEFDFGNYQKCPALNKEAEIRRYTARLNRYLQKNAPEWVSYVDKQIEAK